VRLVLSDIRLTGAATGLDLLDRIAGRGLSCVLMTSLPPSDPLYRSALTRAPVLRKPFSRRQLAALIARETAQ
jgi:DNA-binding NtrC family response regulator